MQTTVTISDESYAQAPEMADPGMEKGQLFQEAIQTFIRVQAAKRLAALGGAAPGMKDVPRRQTESAK